MVSFKNDLAWFTNSNFHRQTFQAGPLWQHLGHHHLPLPLQAGGQWNTRLSIILHSRDPLEGIWLYICVCIKEKIKCNLNKYNLLGKVVEISNSCTWSLTSGQYCQAFRYFGWLTMAPLLVLHCLLCCTAFQMGENLHKIWFLMEEWKATLNTIWFKFNRKEKPTFDSSVHHAPCLPGSLPTGEQQYGNCLTVAPVQVPVHYKAQHF